MPILFNPGKKKGIFMIPSGGTKSPTPPAPSWSSTKSLEFDGVDDYIDLGADSTVGDSGVFTLSFWIKGSTQPLSGFPYLFTSDYYNLWTFFTVINNDIIWTSVNNVSSTLATGVFDDQWHHVFIIWNPTGAPSTIRTYLDGGNVTNNATDWRYAPGGMYDGALRYIGNKPSSTGFDGNLDEVAIWHTDEEANLATIYNSGNPTDLTSLNPVAWYRMGENSTFSSQILMPEQNNKDKFSNYSMAFDGTDDYVDTGITNTGTNDISVSCWIKTKETFVYTNSRCAFGGRNNGSLSNYSLGRLGSDWATPNDMKVRVFNTFGTTKLNDGDWHNIIYTYDYTTKEVKAYVDGNATPEVTFTIASWSTNYIIAIGWNGFDTAYCFEGNVDECAYFTRVLGASDITEIYNSGTPADISGISDLVGYWKMGEEAVFNSTNWLLPNKAQDVFSRYSLDFDGVNDYISLSSVISLGVLSVSFWMKSSDTATGSITNGLGNINFIGTSPILRQSGNNYKYFADQVANFDGNWHHWFVLITGSGTSDISNARMFVDGVELAAGTIVTSGPPSAWTTADIGKGFYGYKAAILDEFAIWQSDETANVATIYNSGEPTDLTSLSPTAWYRMGEDATFSTNWTVPDQIGSNTGTSANMTNDDLSGDAPAVTGNGTSANMDIEDRTGDAPDSSNNSLSYNMDAADIVEETP